jgi:hypothetical protein
VDKLMRKLRPVGKLALALATVAAALMWPLLPAVSQDGIESINSHAYFFRLIAKYMHGDEPVDFDIVVGCNVRVTTYASDSPSYDAFRDLLFFVKATTDEAAVLQIVPNACQGQTTDNGSVPADFLPGAIWFDSKDDFSLGVAYIAEDAFENPNAKLKFLGAEIHPATKEQWEAFKPINAQNLLSPKWFSHIPPRPSIEEVKAHLWNRKKLFEWLPFFDCQGVMRYRLSEPAAQELLRQQWPPSHPRFWRPSQGTVFDFLNRLRAMNHARGPLLDGHYYRKYFTVYETSGFGTRVGGGTFWSGGIASKVYPVRQDDGFPWATTALATAATIYRDVDLMGGKNSGYAYCYNYFRGGVVTETHLPNYLQRQFATRVDGEPLELEDLPGITAADIPSPFFENDEYIYFEFHFSLS